MLKSTKIKALLLTAILSLASATSVQAASYTVASGDSLYKIGKLFNVTSTSIVQKNGLSSSAIYPGQILNVSCRTYTVKSGDSLYLIAKKYGVSIYSLRLANHKWDNAIYPGQLLNIPGSASNIVQATAATTVKTVIPYTTSDANLLARLIEAEAQGEPYQAKVAVGAVVVNRVRDSRFPNTISSVIYQKDAGYYQFTPVVNGWINKPASADSIKAAYAALQGVDPTKGALYYFDDSTTNTWLWSKTVALRVDRMVFSYY
ncbi:cell wall hydrolase [Clostridium oryzae]|uniref:Spore cortex-lytic enzyme n=1 Tax=Clostridium oryzae TaxID=1450648 RepID=A0A1V4IGW9_9CLOT|nr:cell wall hydrolase [Clostridium oryzae]OPJ59232.1 spore cortex-lytic enzyme precursor [Clostridium oryzae]